MGVRQGQERQRDDGGGSVFHSDHAAGRLLSGGFEQFEQWPHHTIHLHGLYLNLLPGCWGNPANFLNDLNHSDMIHIRDFILALSPITVTPMEPAEW